MICGRLAWLFFLGLGLTSLADLTASPGTTPPKCLEAAKEHQKAAAQLRKKFRQEQWDREDRREAKRRHMDDERKKEYRQSQLDEEEAREKDNRPWDRDRVRAQEDKRIAKQRAWQAKRNEFDDEERKEVREEEDRREKERKRMDEEFTRKYPDCGSFLGTGHPR